MIRFMNAGSYLCCLGGPCTDGECVMRANPEQGDWLKQSLSPFRAISQLEVGSSWMEHSSPGIFQILSVNVMPT